MFFFKQKTAYEMRISDWSSDVCSSDLRFRLGGRRTCGCGDVPPNLFRERHAAGAIRRCRSAAFLYVGIPDGAPPPTSFIVTSLDGATNGRPDSRVLWIVSSRTDGDPPRRLPCRLPDRKRVGSGK